MYLSKRLGSARLCSSQQRVVVSASGWGAASSYEICVRDVAAGNKLFEHIMEVTAPLHVRLSIVAKIRRRKDGMLSDGAKLDFRSILFEIAQTG